MLTSAAAGGTSFWSEFSRNWKGPLRRFQYFVAVDGGNLGRRQRSPFRSSKDSSARRSDIANSQSWRITCKMNHRRANGAHRHAVFTIVPRRARCRKLTGKHVELDLSGSETELEQQYYSADFPIPRFHLVRNSVAHGIEQSADRVAARQVARRQYKCCGRSPRGNHIYIEVEDDGGESTTSASSKRDFERGLVSEETADRLTERDLRDNISPGFLTRPKNGIGWARRRPRRRAANLNALNGEIEIESTSGKGTNFTLKVPLTLIISPALFVRFGTTNFGIAHWQSSRKPPPARG